MVRLRLDEYDALAARRRVPSVIDQAALHGISPKYLYRLRSGERGFTLALAMRMAKDLGTSVEVLFELVPQSDREAA